MADVLDLPSVDDPELDSRIKDWLNWDRNKDTRATVLKWAKEKDLKELRAAMLGRPGFGTAGSGMRARMGAGFNRLNDLVIIQTCQGMLKYMEKNCPNLKQHGIIIGYDGRYNSQRFSQLATNIFIRAGVRVYLCSRIVPTPFVSFGVVHCGCDAGIMITASHNPKEDNGFKAYWGNGAQILSPHDSGISEAAVEHEEPWEGSWDTFILKHHPLVRDPLEEGLSAYLEDAKSFCYYKNLNAESPLVFTYSAFHGVGLEFFQQTFAAFGFKKENIAIVEEQKDPNPDFPTVINPNPEEGAEVLGLSFATADKCGSTVVLANDPDADRLQVAEKLPNGLWRVFTGNEMGALLAWWVWHGYRLKNPDKPANDVYLINSTVSTKFVKTMSKVEGFNYEETLTGFKWMANRAQELRSQGKTVLLSWEESIGYMPGNTLDKDGVLSASMFAEYCTYLQKKGMNLSSQLEAIFTQYGHHLNRNTYLICEDKGLKDSLFESIRNYDLTGDDKKSKYPSKFGEFAVKSIRDLTVGLDTAQPDEKPLLPSSRSSQMITFTLENNSIVTLRASGTEPKIKYYIEIISEPGPKESELLQLPETLKKIEQTVLDDFYQVEKYGFSQKH